MKKVISFLLLLAVLASACFALAEDTDDPVVAVVNGEELRQSVYEPYETQYLSYYGSLGLDTTSETTIAYVSDMALTAAIQDLLLSQDIKAQGCDVFTEEIEAWIVEAGTAAWEDALAQVGEYLRSTLEMDADADMSEAALQYADSLGVTAEDYIAVYRTQYANQQYYEWLMKDCPITDEEVQAAYETRVEESRSLYAGDVSAFETAMASGEETWYRPAGYRQVLQILLKAEGDTDEERLASVQTIVDEIYARLNAGEDFTALIAEYGCDSAFDDESFYTTGYSVHRESIVWEDAFINAAFAEDMAAPGSWSTQPFASTAGVHILYYLADAEEGPAELTDEVKEALSYTLYQERLQEKLQARVEELSDAATVEIK